MREYEIKKYLVACHVSKALLNQLEIYIKNEIPKQIGVSKEIIEEGYSLSIREKTGEEKMKSISDYNISLFPDSTNRIKIDAWISHPEKKFSISIVLDKEHSGKDDSLVISYKSNNAREIVLGIHEGIKRIIEPCRNHNDLFHPNLEYDRVLTATKIFFFIFAIIRIQTNHIIALISFLISLMITIYSFTAKTFRQYITYETNHNSRLKKWYNWFIVGLISFVIMLIGFFIRLNWWDKLLIWLNN